MNIRILYNVILNILGIRKILPGEVLRSKPVRECNEPMVRLTPGKGLFLNENATECRQSVAEKLRRVAAQLYDNGMGLYVYDLYRSPERQRMMREETYRFYSQTISDKEELEKQVRRGSAGVGGGHQTGGAVDLTLCDKEGVPLDMGSEYRAKCKEMATSHPLSPIFMERRQLLCSMMQKEGFANYPGEWWHYAYGDQLWASYRYKRYAFYGQVTK